MSLNDVPKSIFKIIAVIVGIIFLVFIALLIL